MTGIVEREPGSAPGRESSARARKDFACDWPRPLSTDAEAEEFRAFLDAERVSEAGSGDPAHCAARLRRGWASPWRELTSFRKSRSRPKACIWHPVGAEDDDLLVRSRHLSARRILRGRASRLRPRTASTSAGWRNLQLRVSKLAMAYSGSLTCAAGRLQKALLRTTRRASGVAVELRRDPMAQAPPPRAPDDGPDCRSSCADSALANACSKRGFKIRTVP